MHYSPGAHFRSSGQTRKFTQWMRNGVTQLPSPPFSHRTPARRRQGRGSSVGMAMSTFQKVTLATCLVLCVALLLPKMLLSRGRKDAAERPEGASPFTAPFIPVKTSSSSMCRGLSARRFSAVTVVMRDVCFGVPSPSPLLLIARAFTSSSRKRAPHPP